MGSMRWQNCSGGRGWESCRHGNFFPVPVVGEANLPRSCRELGRWLPSAASKAHKSLTAK